MPASASAHSRIEWQGKADSESAVMHAIWIKRGAFVSRCAVRVAGLGQGARVQPEAVNLSPRLSISHRLHRPLATTPPEEPSTREDRAIW